MFFNSSDFPRQVGHPKRSNVWNIRELIEYINNTNRYANTYVSVYSYNYSGNEVFYNQPKEINVLYFDFDEDAYSSIIKFRNYCERKKLKSYIQSSGRGYNGFIFCDTTVSINNYKSTIGNAQTSICKEIGVVLDEAVRGDIARICRIPRTWNWSRGRFAIPVSNEQLDRGDEFIKQLSETSKNQGITGIINGDLLNLTKFDTEVKYSTTYVEGPEVELTPKDIDFGGFKNFPICVKNLMNYPNLGYSGRAVVIMFMRDSGYLQKECIELMKQFLSPDRFSHMMKKDKDISYIYSKSDTLWFPRCESLQQGGLCDMKNYNECKKRIY